eukprot:TRINITY_DN18598_c2_g1_i1.p1 TRINITY_DN18598_c2_g1~~TRINITY_DN18598_c2_g1_i1.p1  ORF type:complete len:317 (-),score=42.56 TRINITY_DN18598_c2_g1_i1:127-1077(-)
MLDWEEELSDQYEDLGYIGRGAFGEVRKCIHRASGDIVALKNINIKNKSENLPESIQNEIIGLQKIKHENVMNLREVLDCSCSIVMCMEYCVTDLGQIIQKANQPLPNKFVKAILWQLVNGLAAIHKAGYVHGDLKPGNLMINSRGILKIGDFGLCAPLSVTSKPRQLKALPTRWYRPPELLYGAQKYGQEVDIWSLGCIIGELYNLLPVVGGSSDIDQLAKVVHTFGTLDETTQACVTSWPDFGKLVFQPTQPTPIKSIIPTAPPSVQELVESCLKYDPSKRISSEQILHSDYFKNCTQSECCVIVADFISGDLL